MSFLVPLALVACSALWLMGLKALWGRALLLAVIVGLLFVLLPSVNQDKSLANLAIYQQEAKSFAASVATHIEHGDNEGAKKRLLYFAGNQEWSAANDPSALRSFYKRVELAGQSADASAVKNLQRLESK